MKNENIKNLKIRSKALTMAGVILMTMVFGGCTKSENTQSQTPVEVVNTTTPTIEPTATPEPTIEPTATSVPTAEPTPEPTPELTADEINSMAEMIYTKYQDFFMIDLNEYFRAGNGKQIRQMTVEYVADCIAILNGKQPLYEPYDSEAIIDFVALNVSYCYYVEGTIELYIDFKYAFLPGTYEYELFGSIYDDFKYIMDGNATQEEISKIYGEWLKILVDEPVNGQKPSEVLNVPCYYIAISTITDRILLYSDIKKIGINEISVPLEDIYDNLEGTTNGEVRIPLAILIDQWMELYGLDESDLPEEYKFLAGLLDDKFNSSVDAMKKYVPTENVGLLSSHAYGYDDEKLTEYTPSSNCELATDGKKVTHIKKM